MRKGLAMGLVSVLIAGLLSGCGSSTSSTGTGDKQTPAAPAYPDKPIEFVVPYSAGGGSDIIARQIADIIQKNKFANQPITIVNKPGGSGAVGNAYVYGKKGDKYTIMTMNSGHALSALVNNAEVKAAMFTPIANLAMDNAFLAAKSDFKYKTMKEVIDAAKANPETITIGAVGKGSEDHLCYGMLSETGAKFKYVSFEGSGDVVSAVLGGHVDIGIFNPSEFVGQIEGGKMIALATYAPQRLGGVFKDVPTFTELGFPNVVFQQFRSVMGAPDMPADVVKFWSDTLKKVTETDQWKKDYLEKSMLTGKFMGSDEYKTFHASEEQKLLDQCKKYGITAK